MKRSKRAEMWEGFKVGDTVELRIAYCGYRFAVITEDLRFRRFGVHPFKWGETGKEYYSSVSGPITVDFHYGDLMRLA